MSDDDSWEPMHAAAAYFKQPHDKPLYQTVFFGEGQKFQYPPISLLFVHPLLRLPYDQPTSNRWLNFVSWLAVAAPPFSSRGYSFEHRPVPRPGLRAEPHRPARAEGLAICATLTFYPVIQSFVFGQIQSWLNLLFALALLSWIGKRKGLAGLLLAFSCAIKPQFGLFLLWGGLRREWRFVGGMLVVGIRWALRRWRYTELRHISIT